MVATNSILSGAVVVGVLRGFPAREWRGGKGFSIARVLMSIDKCTYMVAIYSSAIRVPSLFGDPSGKSDFVAAVDKALAKCKSTSS